jgi:prevent-host-death family protein
MKIWSIQDAQARFDELLEICFQEGPQLITRRGADVAVLVPMGEWQRLQRAARPSLKDLLLSDEARADLDVPERHRKARTVNPFDRPRP